MSKGNMLLGHARGKVGSLVFARANGQQITRTRAEVIRNPRTLSQFIQRVFLNTAAQAYAYTKALTDHSFQGKTVGQQSMSEFMKSNLEYMRKRASELQAVGYGLNDLYNFVPVGAAGLYPGAWILSKGKLKRINAGVSAYTRMGTAKAIMYVGGSTYQDVCDAWGLQRGDQLTFVTCEVPANEQDFDLAYVRVILDPREDDGTEAPMSTPFVQDGAIVKPNSKNEGNFYSLVYAASQITFSLMSGDVASVGVIASRNVDGEWWRSPCQMVVSEDVIKAFGGMSLADAIAASQNVTIDVTNQLYLNNAGVGGQQSTNSGGSTQPSTPHALVSNTISLTANGSDIYQDVSGGSITVTEPLTTVIVSGTNLQLGELKAGTTNDVAAATAMELGSENTKARWVGNVAAGSTLYVFKEGTLWFSAAVQADDGGLSEG